MDVMEIDAASNTQVEKIRDFIVDKVHFAPARARFKVYIIDEVHKLSSASFNALLKTLEEPPPHVVFILATTHPHELLPTILSRCQRYDFRPFSLGQIRGHIDHVAAQEGFSLEPEASLCLARAAGGSMRDALVLLEQACAYCGQAVTTQAVTQMLGWLPAQTLEEALQHLQQGEAGRMMLMLQSLAETGQDFVRFVDQLVDQLRLLMLLKVQAVDSTYQELPENQQQSLVELAKALALPQILAWLRSLIDAQQAIREGGNPRLLCEMAMVQLASGAATTAPPPALEALQKRVEALEARPPAGGGVKPQTFAPPPMSTRPPEKAKTPESVPVKTPEPSTDPPGADEGPFRNPLTGGQTRARPPAPDKASAPPPDEQAVDAPKPPPVQSTQTRPPAPASKAGGEIDETDRPQDRALLKEFWTTLLSRVKQSNARLFAVLQEAWPDRFEPPRLLVLLPKDHQFHRDRIWESRSLIEQLSQELLGKEVKLECQFDTTGRKPSGDEEHRAMVKKASGLFAGKIVQP